MLGIAAARAPAKGNSEHSEPTSPSPFLCRYVLRPPLAQDALELTAEGKVLLHLRRPWRDGTRAIRFEPGELLERLVAMIPRPRTNLLIYHGALAPRGCRHECGPGQKGGWAPRSGGEGETSAVATVCPRQPDAIATPPADGSDPRGWADANASAASRAPPAAGAGYVRPRHYTWADLLRRTFAIDILACPDCGGRLRLLATIAQQEVIERILTHLGLPTDPVVAKPARSSEELL